MFGQLYCYIEIFLRVVFEFWEAWRHLTAFWKLDRVDDLLWDDLIVEINLQVPGKKVRISDIISIQNF